MQQIHGPLMVGSSGEDVKIVQSILNRALPAKQIATDGMFGVRTERGGRPRARWGAAASVESRHPVSVDPPRASAPLRLGRGTVAPAAGRFSATSDGQRLRARREHPCVWRLQFAAPPGRFCDAKPLETRYSRQTREGLHRVHAHAGVWCVANE